jgi:hypothetical protein
MSTDPDESEVFSERLPHDNRKFGIRFSGRDYDAVRARADDVLHWITPYASPHISSTSVRDGLWIIEVGWYSLD